jgi:hypothetical protein
MCFAFSPLPLKSSLYQIIIGGARKTESTEKPTDLPQVTGKLYHIMLYRLGEIRTRNVSCDKY